MKSLKVLVDDFNNLLEKNLNRPLNSTECCYNNGKEKVVIYSSYEDVRTQSLDILENSEHIVTFDKFGLSVLFKEYILKYSGCESFLDKNFFYFQQKNVLKKHIVLCFYDVLLHNVSFKCYMKNINFFNGSSPCFVNIQLCDKQYENMNFVEFKESLTNSNKESKKDLKETLMSLIK